MLFIHPTIYFHLLKISNYLAFRWFMADHDEIHPFVWLNRRRHEGKVPKRKSPIQFTANGRNKCSYGAPVKTENKWVTGSMTIVGGFNPFEKYQSNWIISPGSVEKIKNM